ncbi:MAG: recombination regulator RecX [Candidatus Omnitrophica bacterium]|nr:recombination regulator RecX [Candidatus Omnitrophota bacterium]MCF7887818.1 recombination regulator RecX [Candidatus Omnitrophota bacterium]
MKSFSKALNYAFLLLRFRPRSEFEIRTRLKKRKVPLSVIKEVINYLKDANYINDQEFIKSYIDSCLAKGWGPMKANLKLKEFGISVKLRSQALEQIENKSQKLIDDLIEKKINYLRESAPGLEKNKIKAKLVRYLAAKGFYYKDIYIHLNNKFD